MQESEMRLISSLLLRERAFRGIFAISQLHNFANDSRRCIHSLSTKHLLPSEMWMAVTVLHLQRREQSPIWRDPSRCASDLVHTGRAASNSLRNQDLL